MNIELGNGDKLVTDIFAPDGEWCGIAISEGDCPVGEFADIEAETVGELEPLLTITTKDPKSLDVIIAACERAKAQVKLVCTGRPDTPPPPPVKPVA